MRPVLKNALAIAVGVVIVASCDTRTSLTGSLPGGPTGSVTDAQKPRVTINQPLNATLVNVGDSILVRITLHDDAGLQSASVVGLTVSGNVDLGNYTQTPRFPAVGIPVGGSFREGLRDTVIQRYIKPGEPLDISLDSMIVRAYVNDAVGNRDSASVRVNIVSGPRMKILLPRATGDSISAGATLSLQVQAEHPAGVDSITVRVQGQSNWPTLLDTVLRMKAAGSPTTAVLDTFLRVPSDAPVRGILTITGTATDVNRQPGSAGPAFVAIKTVSAAPPLVHQTVPAKAEFSDSITVDAQGEGITYLGIIVSDSANTVLRRDSVAVPAPPRSNAQAKLALQFTSADQGQRFYVGSYAVDEVGRTGYSVRQGVGVAQPVASSAWNDTTTVVYGHTFAIPVRSPVGQVVADIAVDTRFGNVFVTNTSANLIEIWNSATQTFAPTGVAVGAEPWGMFVSNNPDTLLVANSGATTISRVFIGSATPSAIREDLAHTLRTRNSYIYVVTVSKDDNGVIRLSLQGPVSYSDRPQYIAQSAGGRIYYSTRPTQAAPAGTIRWLDPDPAYPYPDPRQVWQYGTRTAGSNAIYAIFNVDSVFVRRAPPGAPTVSDSLILWDHDYGQISGDGAAIDPDPVIAALNLRASFAGAGRTSDVELVEGLDITTLGLTDTTFVAASANREWIGFGEGNTGGAGRIMMAQDPAGGPQFFSPTVTVLDLTDNAAERVIGLAIDSIGRQVGSQGADAYFAAVDNPFHLRLEGTYDSPANGAGVAFHMRAKGPTTPEQYRVAFVASSDGRIDIVDVAHWSNRGTLLTKGDLRGPLRVSGPMPGEPADMMHLYALSSTGLVVIDITSADIKPGP